MIKREQGAESNEKLPQRFIPSKTATFVPEFAVKDLPLDRTLWWWLLSYSCICKYLKILKLTFFRNAIFPYTPIFAWTPQFRFDSKTMLLFSGSSPSEELRGPPCDTTEDCPQDATCSAAKFCQCANHYVISGDWTRCLQGIKNAFVNYHC